MKPIIDNDTYIQLQGTTQTITKTYKVQIEDGGRGPFYISELDSEAARHEAMTHVKKYIQEPITSITQPIVINEVLDFDVITTTTTHI